MARRAAATLAIHLAERAAQPLHAQVYAQLRAAIVTGVIPPSSRLASSRALAAELAVSRTTTQLALDQLRAEGYLVTRHGAGTFVAARLPDDAPFAPAAAPSPAPRALLSRRGEALVAGRPGALRIPGPARAFRLGSPALEAFPMAIWSRLAARRIAALTARELDYGGGAGLPALRAAIAEHVRISRGVRCDAEQIYVCHGAQRGLELVCRLLLDAGDTAAVEDPGYPGAWSALAAAGARIAPVPVDADGLDVAALARVRGVRLVYVTPAHQFPSGARMSVARRRALVAWAAASGAWIVEDDYDSEFRFDARPLPCLQGADDHGRAIYVGTFSKTVFPALRIGFVVAPPDLHAQLAAVRTALVDPPPATLDQAILADFIAEGHFARHLRRMTALYAERRAALGEAARRWCGGALALRPTRTGLHAVAELRGLDAARVCAEGMRRGLELMPLSAYSLERRGAAAIALGFSAVAPARLDRGMQELAAAIEAVQRAHAAA